jgi:NUMOD1 domain.
VDNLEWVTASENVRHRFSVLGHHSNNKGKLGKDFYASKKVYQYNLDGTFNREWNAVSDAARFYKCNPSQIINNISGRNITAHGFCGVTKSPTI